MRPLHEAIPPTSGLGGIKGFLIGKPGIKHAIYQLTGDKGRTVLRPFPEIQNGKEMPWRNSEGDWRFSDWLVVDRAVAYAGLGDKFTCMTQTAGHENDGNESGYLSPIETFFRTLRKALKDTPKQFYEAGVDEWLKWHEFKGPLPAPDRYGFMQGMLFESKGKPFLAPDNRTQRPAWPVILMVKSSAVYSLGGICNKEVDNFAGNPEDYSARYASGDPVSCAAGKLIEFNLMKGQGNQGGGGGGGAFGAWYESKLGASLPLDPRLVVPAWKPWKELLNYLTEQEQMNLLIGRFPPEALDYVFRGTVFYDYLGGNIKGKWNQQLTKRQVPAPAPMPYPQGYPGFIPPGYPIAPGQVMPGQAAPYPPPGPGQAAPYPPPGPGQAAPYPPAVAPGYPVPYPGMPMAPVPPAPAPMIPPGSYPPNPQLPPGYVPAGQVVPVPTTVTPAAAPVQMPPGIDLSGGFQQAGQSNPGEGEEEAPGLAGGTPSYPPPGAVQPPFDGGRPYTPPGVPNAPQAPMPAAPAPVQPMGDPSAASSAAAAARARLQAAQQRAAAVPPPQQ